MLQYVTLTLKESHGRNSNDHFQYKIVATSNRSVYLHAYIKQFNNTIHIPNKTHIVYVVSW